MTGAIRLALLILIIGINHPAVAAEQWSEPIYNPGSKSYFQLVGTGGAQTGITWDEARRRAAKKLFKGVEGRLAIVGSQETHVFLRDSFDVSYPTWIGLRYWCQFRKLQWVTADIHYFTSFNYWAPQWYRNEETRCSLRSSSSEYMPVYYLPEESGFAWQASGAPKFFEYYLIEYPTGAP